MEKNQTLDVYKQKGEELEVERVEGSSLSLSREASQLSRQLEASTAIGTDTAENSVHGPLNDGDMALSDKMKLAKQILQAMMGEPIRLSTPQSRVSEPLTHEGHDENVTSDIVGMRFDQTETYSESEQLHFSGQALIQTTEGEEYALDLAFVMSRHFSQTDSLSFSAGVQLEDPLVINFDGSPVQLTDNKMAFDFDSDGDDELVHQLAAGSGFLMLDKNGDGVASNGGELFGATTGNGFVELAAYDDDGNGFIDEGDAIYGQLQIWVKQGSKEQTYSLAEKDVGAIYLGAIATPFELKNGENELLGVVRGSSFYLGDQGSSGSVQQIDLVV